MMHLPSICRVVWAALLFSTCCCFVQANTAQEKAALLVKLAKTFPGIAKAENTTLEVLLNKTVFEIIGDKPEDVMSVMSDHFQRNFSAPLVRLLNFTTLAELRANYPIITNFPILAGKNYNYPVMNFIISAEMLDQTTYTQIFISMFISMNIQIASHLNTTTLTLMQKRYLTGVYQMVKKAAPVLFRKPEFSYYFSSTRFRIKPPLKYQRQFIGDATYKELERLRSTILHTAIELDQVSFSSAFQNFSRVLPASYQMRLGRLQEIFAKPLNNSFLLCRIDPSIIGSLTFDALIRTCMNFTKEFPIASISPSYLPSPINFGEASQFLNKPFKELDQYDITMITKLMSEEFTRRQKSAMGPLIEATYKANISLVELSSMKIRDVGPRIMNMSDKVYYAMLNLTKTNQYMNVTVKELETQKGVSVNALASAQLPDILTALSPYNETLVKAAVSKGLFSVASTWTLGKIAKLYVIQNAVLQRFTLVTLANYLGGVNEQEFAKLFNVNSKEMIRLKKISIADGSVLLKYANNIQKPINDYKPTEVSSLLNILPSSLARLMDTLYMVSNSTGTELGKLTLQAIQSYGNWTDPEVLKLAMAIGMQVSHFIAVKQFSLLGFSHLLNVPLSQLGNGNIIQLIRHINVPATNTTSLQITMQQTFHTRAALMDISFNDLLNMTWFKIVGATPEKLTEQGITKMLPLQPSNAFIHLMNTTSIAEQAKSYKPIISVPTLLNKNYNYSVLTYFSTALHLDSANLTTVALRGFPGGNASIAYLYNTTDAGLKKLRYLTEVYPKLSKNLPDALEKTEIRYYETLPGQTLNYRFFRELMGAAAFKHIEGLRLKYARSAIDLNGPAAVADATAIGTAIVVTVLHRYSVVSTAFLSPLQNSYSTCKINSSQLGLYTMSAVLHICIDVSNDFPMAKFFPIRAPGNSLMSGTSIGKMASFIQMPLANFANYSMLNVLIQLSVDSKLNVSVSYQAFIHKLKYSDLAGMTLSHYATKVDMIPAPAYLNNKTIMDKLSNMTFGALRPILNKRMNADLSLNALYTIPYPYIIKMFIFDTKNILITGIANGLTLMAHKASIDKIRQMYDVNPSFLGEQTLVTLAHHVSGISSVNFLKLFDLSPQQMVIVGKARIKDLRVLVKLAGSNVTADNFTPVVAANFVYAQPASSTMLLESIDFVASSRKVSLQDLTVADLQKFGSWSNLDVDNLLKSVGTPRSFFDELKPMKFSMLSRVIHTPLQEIAKFNIIDVVKALCSAGKHFNGKTCVAFSGCSSAPASICTANAQCVDFIGSYICRCKTGFSGNGTTCHDACQSKVCPSNSKCRNVPDKGAICKCTKPLQVLKNNQCVDVKSKLFKVIGTKFDQPYNDKYKDKTSKEYTSKKAEVEQALFDTLVKKIFGLLAVLVTDITKGSIVVDYNVVVDVNAQNVTTSIVQNATVEALNDPNLKAFKPVKSSQPSAQASDICESGHDCGRYSRCVLIGDGNYRCDCIDDYEMKGGNCVKKSNKAVKIAVPIVVIVVVLFVLLVIIHHQHKKRCKTLEVPYDAQGKASPTSLELGARNNVYDKKE